MALRLLVVVLLAAVADGHKATPIEKVTELLKGLQAKVTEEGKKEAAAYDKYACFCKEQADEKLYAIEKSTAKIDDLSEQIKDLNTEIASLDADISDLSTKATDLEDKIKKEADARAKSHDKYLAKARDLLQAIDACGAAIEAMKEAKGGLKDAKVNLAQISSLALSHGLGAPKYQFQGNDIIATLEDLLANFNQMKKELDQDEFDVNSVFEKEALGDTNELKFANKEKDEKEALNSEKSEELNAAKADKDQESKDRAADNIFMETLTNECEVKAKLFDQRSKTRSDELTAMTGAIEQLEKGVKPNEGANKNLVGLVQGNLSPSFIQIRTLNGDSNRAVKKVQALLQEQASLLDSSILKGAAARVMLAADHFVKVRTLIKDLIAKLAADAKAEAEQKSFCDKAMKAALEDRDSGVARKEAANSKLTSLNARKDELNNQISDLAAAIAENKKAVNEATELRNQEKADNEQTLAEADEAHQATTMALNILSDFYKNAFLQTRTKYVPPKADRDGNTVGDLAPDTGFDDDYHGAQGESKGIIGILEVIASDFDRTIKTVTEEEKGAQTAFEKFEKETNDDSDAKQGDIDTKDGEIKEAEAKIVDETDELKDATDLHESASDKLEDLKAECVEGEETWEERAAARKKEIEALKEAQTILDEWQG